MDLKLFELNSLLNGLQQVSKQTQFVIHFNKSFYFSIILLFIKIECCTYSNTILYVGTNDGLVNLMHTFTVSII